MSSSTGKVAGWKLHGLPGDPDGTGIHKFSPATDRKTLRAIRAKKEYLQELIDSTEFTPGTDQNQVAAWEKEIKDLKAYRSNCATPGNDIRDSNANWWNSAKASINRNMGAARDVLRKSGLEILADHLEHSISSMKKDFVYNPGRTRIAWKTSLELQ